MATGPASTLFSDPFGNLRVEDLPSQLLADEFDASGSLDTGAVWGAPQSGNGAVAASTASGNLTLATGTTANGYSYLQTQTSFRSTTPAWIRYAFNIAIADGAAPIANSYRYWGSGSPNGTPTVAAPVLNGAGFEITTAGHLCCVLYTNGVRIQIADLTASGYTLDAGIHNYSVYYRPTKSYWFGDDQNVPLAVSTLANSALNIDSLPAMYMAVGGPTPPASSAVLSSNAMSISDTGKNNTTISDGRYPFRRLSVTPSGYITTTPAARQGTILDVVGTAAAGAQVTATLPASAGAVCYLTGFELTWDGSGTTSTTSDVLTLAGTTNALAWKFATEVNVGGMMIVEFPQPIPGSAVNTAITLSSGTVANRAGLSLVMHGYR